MFNIDFTPEQLLEFYRGSSNKGRQAIKEALGDKLSEALPITERVKTYEDAVRELGENHPYVECANSAQWRYEGKDGGDIIAYLKLRVIVAALNEGWEPKFTEGERRYYPCYSFYTKKEVDEMTKEEKEELGLVWWGGNANSGTSAGLAFASSQHAFSASSSTFGARIALKTSDLAIYAGKQFIDIFANFCLIPSKNEEKE